MHDSGFDRIDIFDSLTLNTAMKRWAAIIADDDIGARSQIAEHATDLGFDIIVATNAEEIVASSRETGSEGHVILVSAALPDLDPTILRRELSRARGRPYLILILNRHAPEPVTSAFETGADEVITKPLIVAELDARLQRAARILELEDMRAHFEGEASLIAEISARTVMHSRRYFDALLMSELTRAARYAHPTGLILAHMDWDVWEERDMRALDHFFSAWIRSSIDWMARFDEHTRAFVLPETTLYGALTVTRRLSSEFSIYRLRKPMNLFWNVAIYFGVISLDPAQISSVHPPDSKALIDAAEGYLQDAIRSGHEITAGPVPYDTRSSAHWWE